MFLKFNVNNQKGFTLLEIMVVVILMGLIAAFSIPNYSKSVRTSHEKDAILQLTMIHNANELYRSRGEMYLDTGAGTLDYINTSLDLQIIANGMAYTYARTQPLEYTAEAAWDELGTSHDFEIIISQDPIDLGSTPPNPCCKVGTNCPSLASC